MMWPRVASLDVLPDRKLLFQFSRYGLAGAAAATTHLSVLVILAEVAQMPATLASALGFVCAMLVNYALQHAFVFNRSSQHMLFFRRYVTITLLTLALNTVLFWALTTRFGMFYIWSQVIAIGMIVPLNYMLNRCFTFVDGTTAPTC